jgi:hypothetical protein
VSLVPASQVMGMPMIVGAHSEDEVQLALDWAADSIESYCERKFAYVETDTVFINPYRGDGGRPQALLPNPPVTNVSTVLAQMPIEGGLSWVELQYYGWAADGLIYDTARYYGYFGVTGSSFWSGVANADGFFDYGNVPSWPTLPRSLQVSYSHGFVLPGNSSIEGVPNLPTGVVNAVIKGAALFLDNQSGAVSVRVGELSTTFIDPLGHPAGWLDEKLLGEYRLVHL